jgi:5-methylcytosine-specific restriction endonuclease McrA
MARFHHKTPQTIQELRGRFYWDREERLTYIRNRYRASNYTHRPEVRTRIFQRDGYQCRQCGSSDNLTIDHIISVYRGGSNEDSNLQTLCNSCNAGKVT